MSSIIETYLIDEIENLLCQIEDVQAARIVVGTDQTIQEVHILANSIKGPKQLSRDIESVLMAKYGISLNHRKISIAQINNQAISFNKARPKLIAVKHEILNMRARVSVTLEFNGKEYEGAEEGVPSKMGRLRLVAGATLHAIEKIVPDTYGFALEDITAIKTGKDMAVIVLIAILSLEGDETFVGCALVRDDERESIVRAVLDAVNRRLSFLIT
ncbi:MAG TPA: hypothetical protein VGK02_11815 [Candidatus Aquicultor sp.]|jgi:hypothetical protein